ncbi:MAG: HEAT repeat domain-containing protein [Opitutales bacterium]|nr:HEAT repeat domain-containing protein [Opitutales bacterium]
MKFLRNLAACAFLFSAFSAFAGIDAERIKRDIQVMSGEIAQPVKFNNQNRSFRDKDNREYEYRDGHIDEMSQYQYQDDLLNLLFEATKNPSDLAAFEREILSNLESVKDPNTKCELIRMLEFAGSERSLPLLKKTALSADENAAIAACGALQKIADKRAGDALVEVFKAAKNPKVKQMALFAAARRGDKKAFVSSQKKGKFAQTALDGSKTLIPTALDEFEIDFTKSPSKDKALKALHGENEWQAAFVVPYIFEKENSLVEELNKTYEGASPILRAWIITNASKVQNEASKKFILDKVETEKDYYTCSALALALEKIGGEAAAKGMLSLHEKTRDMPQRIIDWTMERTGKGCKEFDAYIVERAKQGDRHSIRLIGYRNIAAKPILYDMLDTPAWQEALQALEAVADTSDIARLVEIANGKKASDKHFAHRLGYVVRNAAFRTTEPEKLISVLEKGVENAPEAQKDGMKKCLFLGLMECGKSADLMKVAERVAAGKADKIEVSQIPQLAKRLSQNSWRRLPDHQKVEAEFEKILAGAKCPEAEKAALEKSLQYIKNRGEEPRK